MKITGRTRLDAIRSALRADGYDALIGREEDIRKAAVAGALLWTRERLATADASRIDVTPRFRRDFRRAP